MAVPVEVMRYVYLVKQWPGDELRHFLIRCLSMVHQLLQCDLVRRGLQYDFIVHLYTQNSSASAKQVVLTKLIVMVCTPLGLWNSRLFKEDFKAIFSDKNHKNYRMTDLPSGLVRSLMRCSRAASHVTFYACGIYVFRHDIYAFWHALMP